MTNDSAYITKDLPPVLSGDQVRQVLHISKRKCAWLLKNGYIKCTVGTKQSRKYKVKLEDLVAFIEDSREHPEKYLAPFGEFSAAKYNPKPPQSMRYGFPPKLPDDFREWLDDAFADVPDALTIGEIIEITGYTDTSVDRWIVNGWLKSITTQSGKVIAKDWLVDFYCGYGYKIAKMSEKHVELMIRYFQTKG